MRRLLTLLLPLALLAAASPAQAQLGGLKKKLTDKVTKKPDTALVAGGASQAKCDKSTMVITSDVVDRYLKGMAARDAEIKKIAREPGPNQGYFTAVAKREAIEKRKREFDLRLITTAPGVRYRVTTTSGETVEIASPAQLPDAGRIAGIEEPYIRATIVIRSDSLGGILALSQERRGVQQRLEFLAADTVLLGYDFPLAEVVHDFYDRLKSVSRGYASFDYELAGYREGEIVRLDILVNGEPVDSLSLMIHREKAYAKGKALVEKMQELIPRQLFEIVLQAAVGSRVIARASVRPLRKDVLAKCYGGDISRKRKLLEKQKEGKKRMRQFGKVEIPQSAFIAALKMDA